MLSEAFRGGMMPGLVGSRSAPTTAPSLGGPLSQVMVGQPAHVPCSLLFYPPPGLSVGRVVERLPGEVQSNLGATWAEVTKPMAFTAFEKADHSNGCGTKDSEETCTSVSLATLSDGTDMPQSDSNSSIEDNNSNDGCQSAWTPTATQKVQDFAQMIDEAPTGGFDNEDLPVGTHGVPSIGSEYHDIGFCRPCNFTFKSDGCRQGAACKFCHLCGPGMGRRRKNERKKFLIAIQRSKDGIATQPWKVNTPYSVESF
mmetsp:Transcript_21357/g.66819  ORF Transcript_21357/g.66819 Transcript_21357/m.66819 type:complete len:256 (-) Transcript_21357:93-860(-)